MNYGLYFVIIKLICRARYFDKECGKMIDLSSKKGKTLVSRIIVVVLCIAMVVTLLVSAF